ncbi:rod shape-determining protein MreD [Peterkaempfera bronchialis]|uniref:Rod shape-determining protein MreD n=1 Tax=Peterkaempfera bronchialis TaxID=2126346 RepID=A0A345SUZ6_9ACTN|nr:rod shape-determining protein MreD [Peterkaempfera bronchialis]AXI77551.1 rod shape-determining protein MreD [Peterkaempfera bronchialis]
MRLNRMLLPTVLIVVALVVQVSVLARLGLPGAVPDLLLLVVVGLGLVYGPTGGCIVGFAAGLLADVAPPSDHAIGRYALVLCILGYAAGLARPESRSLRSVTGPLLVVAVAAVASTLLYAAVGALVGDTAARHVGLAGLVFTALVYDVLLAPFVVPAVMALARRGEPDPMVTVSGIGPGGSAGGSAMGTLSAYARGTSYGGGKRKGRLSGLVRRP